MNNNSSSILIENQTKDWWLGKLSLFKILNIILIVLLCIVLAITLMTVFMSFFAAGVGLSLNVADFMKSFHKVFGEGFLVFYLFLVFLICLLMSILNVWQIILALFSYLRYEKASIHKTYCYWVIGGIILGVLTSFFISGLVLPVAYYILIGKAINTPNKDLFNDIPNS